MSDKKVDKMARPNEVAELMKSKLVFTDGVCSLNDKDFEDLLPKEPTADGILITPEHVKMMRKIDVDVCIGARKALGHAAIDAFVDDKKLDQVALKMNMMGARYESTVSRETTSHNPSTGEKVVKHGSIRDSFTLSGYKKGGVASSVKKEIEERARNLLGE